MDNGSGMKLRSNRIIGPSPARVPEKLVEEETNNIITINSNDLVVENNSDHQHNHQIKNKTSITNTSTFNHQSHRNLLSNSSLSAYNLNKNVQKDDIIINNESSSKTIIKTELNVSLQTNLQQNHCVRNEIRSPIRSRPTIQSKQNSTSNIIERKSISGSESESEIKTKSDQQQVEGEKEQQGQENQKEELKPKRRRLKRPIWDRPKKIENQLNNETNKNISKNNLSIDEGLQNETIISTINNEICSLLKSVQKNNDENNNDDNHVKSENDDSLRSSPMNISLSSCNSEDENTNSSTVMIARTTTTSIKSFCSTLPPVTYDPSSYGVIEQPEQVEPAREPDDEPNKIFVGGLPWDTTEYDLEFYFSHFGKVTEINIKYDPLSCLTRGFCFVTFQSEETVNLILKKPIHMIKGKMIELKRAKYRPICKKVFVGGLDPRITENDLKTYFSQYGTVVAIETPKDRLRNRKREFCFVIFESEFSAERACIYPKQYIGHRLCDVKKAQPQPICYQQKRMAQTAGLEISNAHLNKILLGESGRTITASNGASETGTTIPGGVTPEAISPLMTPIGTLLYYQTIPPNRIGASAITSRVVPMAARPIIGYPTYQIPQTTDYTNPLYATINGLTYSNSNGTTNSQTTSADFYVNYYAQTAAYYAQQQQQQQQQLQLSISTNSTTTTTTSTMDKITENTEIAVPKPSINPIIGKPMINQSVVNVEADSKLSSTTN